MAENAGIVGKFIGHDVAVVDRRRAECADDDVADIERIAAGGVRHADRPVSGGALAAEGLALERPGAVKVIAAAGAVDQAAHRAVRRGDIDVHVAGEGGRQCHLHRDAVDNVVEERIASEAQACGVVVRDQRIDIEHVHAVGELVGRRLGDAAAEQPGLRQAHRRQRIDQAVAIVIAEMLAAAVPCARPIEAPGIFFRTGDAAADRAADMAGGAGEDRLHIAPAKPGIGVVHQRHHAGDHRRGGGGAVKA